MGLSAVGVLVKSGKSGCVGPSIKTWLKYIMAARCIRYSEGGILASIKAS